jgi:hypothetical protein
MTEMAPASRTTLRRLVIGIVVVNILVFGYLAFSSRISGAPETIVFVDFWGRFVVYSLWFVGYALYRRYLDAYPQVQTAIIALVTLNIPLFLILSYFDKVKVTPENLAVVDFWGRLTVYSFWFMLYELYRKYLGKDA